MDTIEVHTSMKKIEGKEKEKQGVFSGPSL